MIDIKQLLYKITENEEIFDENIDLLESGILDSFSTMLLIDALENEGINIRLNKDTIDCFRTIKGIESLVNKAKTELEKN